jgi:hypothetical protein
MRGRRAVPVGAAVLFLGLSFSNSSAARAQERIWKSDDNDIDALFGKSVAILPDLDADGLNELLIGSNGLDCSSVWAPGAAHEVSTSGGELHVWCGEQSEEALGLAVELIGDVDLDGVEDFAIGSPNYDAITGNFVGRVQVVSATTGIPIYQVVGNVDGIALGSGIARLSDLDGDGYREMLVSAPAYSGLGAAQGEVFVLSTKDASSLRLHQGEAPQHRFGASIGALGDVDGDGIDDYAIGAHLSLMNDGEVGRFYVYSGATGAELWRVTGKDNFDKLGRCLADGGDIDHDGFADLLASGRAGLLNGGHLDAYSGASGSLLFQIDGVEAAEGFGEGPVMVGDVNDDSYGDYLVGAPFSTRMGNYAGRAELISGATLRTLYNFYPGPPGYKGGTFGSVIRSGADFNGDGLNDFIISAPSTRFTYPRGGRVSIFAANDLYLQAAPRVADVNDAVTMDVRGGAPGAFSIVFLTDISGTPFFDPVMVDFLDANGEMTQDFLIPVEAAGLDFTFQAYATRRPKSPHFIDSSPFTVSIN